MANARRQAKFELHQAIMLRLKDIFTELEQHRGEEGWRHHYDQGLILWSRLEEAGFDITRRRKHTVRKGHG